MAWMMAVRRGWVWLLAGCVAVGCASPGLHEQILLPPHGTTASAASAMEDGNRLFASEQWADAQRRYEQAIEAAPTLAEAHYNLALTLERLGRGGEARRHYIEAANLAPGHTIIWNSPPLRQHGDVTPRSSGTGTRILPAFGH